MPDGEGNVEVQTSPGEARKLIERTKKNPEQHLVLFSEVANKVLKVNPAIHAPFNLKENEQSNLGMFAQDAYTDLDRAERKTPHKKGQKFGEYWEGHDRSTIIARVLFKDDQGRLYRDVDLKGAGWLLVDPRDRDTRAVSLHMPGQYDPQPEKMMGLVGLDEAMADYENSEDFLKAGIRTSRVIAIIELKEIIYRNKVPVEVEKHSGNIGEDFTPVIEVRAFATKTRFSDLDDYDELTKSLMVEDAKKLIAQELGRKELTDQEYTDWLIDTLGRSVGLIHKNGWIHGGLRGQNITLDGKIVDLDTVETSSNSKKRVQDIDLISDELSRVRDKLLRMGATGDWDSFYKRRDEVKEKFMQSYYNAFPKAKKTKLGELLKAA